LRELQKFALFSMYVDKQVWQMYGEFWFICKSKSKNRTFVKFYREI